MTGEPGDDAVLVQGFFMELHEVLREPLETLRRAYPEGVPDSDYLALLAELGEDMSERNLAIVVAELIDGESVVVTNDAAAALSVRRPAPADRARVRSRIEEAGWPRSDDSNS